MYETNLKDVLRCIKNSEKISAIYVDDANRTMTKLLEASMDAKQSIEETDLYDRILKSKENILNDLSYVEYDDDGNYYLNKEKIFEDFGDFVISMNLYTGSDEECNTIIDKIYLKYDKNRAIKNHNYDHCRFISEINDYVKDYILIIIDKKFTNEKEKCYIPMFQSKMECYVLSDYVQFEDNVRLPDGEVIDYTESVIAVVKSKNEAMKIIEQRIGYYTAINHIKNGKVVSDENNIYYTNLNGSIDDLGKVADYIFGDTNETGI